MAKEAQRKASRLGKGLSSLMQSPVAVHDPPAATPAGLVAEGPPPESDGSSAPRSAGGKDELDATQVRRVAVASIHPNPHQPRQHFDEAALASLADSIRRDGLMQPIILRPGGERGPYEIVAGERRWRAAKLAGLERVPAVVRALDDAESAQWALIENLQREDLNPMERAEAFSRLGDLFDLSHDEIAERVGLDRSTVTNLLRLLRLEPTVQGLVRDGVLSMGQSRALAGVGDEAVQRALAQRAVREGMSVRQVEAAARGLNDVGGGGGDGKSARRTTSPPAHLADLERSLATQLGTKVRLKASRKKGAGTLSIDFYSLEQFDALLARMGVSTEA